MWAPCACVFTCVCVCVAQVGRNAVPVGLRSENVLLKILGWTLWSFTLMLGALLIFNKYFSKYDDDAASNNFLPNAGAGGDTTQQQQDTPVKTAMKLGFRNTGSWLLSTSALGLLSQLTFALPRIAALHKVTRSNGCVTTADADLFECAAWHW